jgi:anti-sigma factor RsiW
MKCKKICDLLKSDYLDGELNDKLRREIERHLGRCPACRLLKQELDSQRIALHSLEKQEVPVQIWQNIQNTILQEQIKQRKNVFSYVREGLRRLLYSPRPAFVLASSLAVCIIILFVGKLIVGQRGPFDSAIGENFFGDYRLNGFAEAYNFGTEIEEYFL